MCSLCCPTGQVLRRFNLCDTSPIPPYHGKVRPNYTPTNEVWGNGILESPCPPVRLSVHPCVTKSCPGHNFISIKASNLKLHTQIGLIVEKCSAQEP